MHLLEAYAMASGAMIDRCFIHEEEITLPEKPYITLHSYNPKGSGRQYRHWNELIEKLNHNPKFNYQIIQIGGSNDQPTIADTSYLGQTNYHSLAYLIKNSAMHLGFDSLPVHLASYYDKKMVILYAHYAANSRPYFSSNSNIILLEPDHTHIKPVFANDDAFDQINTIKVNSIYQAIIKILDIE